MRKGLSATDFGLSFISTNPTQMLPGSLLRRVETDNFRAEKKSRAAE